MWMRTRNPMKCIDAMSQTIKKTSNVQAKKLNLKKKQNLIDLSLCIITSSSLVCIISLLFVPSFPSPHSLCHTSISEWYGWQVNDCQLNKEIRWFMLSECWVYRENRLEKTNSTEQVTLSEVIIIKGKDRLVMCNCSA